MISSQGSQPPSTFHVGFYQLLVRGGVFLLKGAFILAPECLEGVPPLFPSLLSEVYVGLRVQAMPIQIPLPDDHLEFLQWSLPGLVQELRNSPF